MEEGRTVDAGGELQAQLGVGLVIFGGLQVHEQEAEQEGRRQEHLQDAAMAGAQRVVRDGDRDTGGQQDGGVHRGQAESRDRLEGVVRLAADQARAVGRPGRVVVLSTAAAC